MAENSTVARPYARAVFELAQAAVGDRLVLDVIPLFETGDDLARCVEVLDEAITLALVLRTGALTAPFAFLGPAYDDQLKRFYTELTPSDIVRKRSIVAALTSDALSDNEPLKQLVTEQVDEAFLAAVAAAGGATGAHRKSQTYKRVYDDCMAGR